MSQSGPSGFRKFFSKKVDEDKVEEEILSMVEEGHEQGLMEKLTDAAPRRNQTHRRNKESSDGSGRRLSARLQA